MEIIPYFFTFNIVDDNVEGGCAYYCNKVHVHTYWLHVYST